MGAVVTLAAAGGPAHASARAMEPARQAQSLRTSLPLVSVTTQRRIRDEPRTRARLRIIDHGPAGNSLRDRANAYDGWAGIELRGQSSQTFPKKSYGVELRERSGRKRREEILGMPAEDDWILYAAYNDKTLMRNVVAYDTTRRLGRWAARTRFVELVLNGRYEGVYVLMERVELGKNRVVADKRGLTGRYLLELTFPYQARRKGAHFVTPVVRRPILYADPGRSDLSDREASYVRGVVGRAERALYRGRPGAWRRHLDEGAAVDYVLMQELFRNVDAFHGSTFLTKGSGARLALGPVWDFDLAMGNSTAGRSRFVTGWWTRERDWAERLHRDADFRRALRRRWRELRAAGLRAAVLASVDRNAALVRRSVGRNFRRWPVLHRRVFQNPAARGSHTAEVRFLRSWLSRRIAWMDRATRPPPSRRVR